MISRRGGRLVSALALLALGLLIGVAGAFVQAGRVVVEAPWGTVSIPWGVPFVWIALVAAIRGGAWALRSRWGGWSVALGWLVATVALSAESPSGDVALSGGGRQFTYLLGGVILASAAASLPVPRRPAAGSTPSRRRSGSPAGNLDAASDV